MLKDTTAMLALLDSTMATFSRPYLKEAAPYIWARAEARRNAGKYRDAVNDMNDYEKLMSATINDNFYYVRHQTHIQARLYQQALNDINRAIQMNPRRPSTTPRKPRYASAWAITTKPSRAPKRVLPSMPTTATVISSWVSPNASRVIRRRAFPTSRKPRSSAIPKPQGSFRNTSNTNNNPRSVQSGDYCFI